MRRHRAHHDARYFSSTSQRAAHLRDHYETLGVPSTATKAQIKTSFYQLSKKYHPDVTQDCATQGKFHVVSEAYAVLGDDRKRREYDRRFRHSSSQSHSSPQHPQATTTRPSHQAGSRNAWQNNPRQQKRNPNASHAHDPSAAYDHPWERARAGKYTYYQPPPGAHSSTSYTWSHTDPFSSPHVQRATGRRSAGPPPGTGPSSGGGDGEMGKGAPRPERKQTDEDEAAAESVVGRVFAVSGLLSIMLVIAQIAGAPWGSAHA